MKRQLTLLMVAAMTALQLAAAEPAKKAAKPRKQLVEQVYKTDIHCDGCARKIMNNVPALGRGVEDVKVDVPTKTVTVVYDAAKTNSDNIVRGLRTLSVEAQPVKGK